MDYRLFVIILRRWRACSIGVSKKSGELKSSFKGGGREELGGTIIRSICLLCFELSFMIA